MRGWLLAAWLCLPGLASAESWLSDPAESRLAFEARWEGSPVPGEFRRFSVRLQADPGEWHNLAGEAAYAGVRDELHAAILAQFDPDEIDRNGEIPDEVIRGLAEMGAFGIKTPKEYGGLGMSHESPY